MTLSLQCRASLPAQLYPAVGQCGSLFWDRTRPLGSQSEKHRQECSDFDCSALSVIKGRALPSDSKPLLRLHSSSWKAHQRVRSCPRCLQGLGSCLTFRVHPVSKAHCLRVPVPSSQQSEECSYTLLKSHLEPADATSSRKGRLITRRRSVTL